MWLIKLSTIGHKSDRQEQGMHFLKSALFTKGGGRREEEKHVTAKNLKQAESPAYTKSRIDLPTNSQFNDLQHHNAVLPL